MKKSPMVVKVVSQVQFNYTLDKNGINDSTVDKYSNSIFISITGTGDTHYFKANHYNVLNIRFDDLTDEEAAKIKNKPVILFTEEHARTIIDFLERNKDKNYCWVHCAAGVSRSGAVGTFINDLYSTVDYFTFMNQNRNVKPNAYILALLRRTYNEGDSGDK